ncbi:unnamed protein product [Jaminaea pallidilutea]
MSSSTSWASVSPQAGPSSSSSFPSSAEISLPVHPSHSLGPFVLGSSIHSVLTYLRQPYVSSSHYPHVEVAYDVGSVLNTPIRVRPTRGLDLIFARPQAGPPRLVCIVVSLQSIAGATTSSEVDDDEDDGRSSAHDRQLKPLLKAQSLQGLPRGKIQQLLGPTYPAKRHTRGDGLHVLSSNGTQSRAYNDSQSRAQKRVPTTVSPALLSKSSATTASSSSSSSAPATAAARSPSPSPAWILSYEGLSFLFDDKGSDPSRDARPTHLVVCRGSDPLDPEELRWPIPAKSAPGPDTTTTSPHGLQLCDAQIHPGRGVTLSLLAAPSPPPDISEELLAKRLAKVELLLNKTSQQDALLDLGSPERPWSKSQSAHVDEGSNGLMSRPEFWSYPSLGLDLLFRASTSTEPSSDDKGGTNMVLHKVVLHSDVPGSAAWGRYEFAPWSMEVAPQAQSGLGASKPFEATIDTKPSELFDHLSQSRPSERETMHLDRSAQDEFRGRLHLDVRTELRGFPGCVAEVLPEGKGERGSLAVIVAWTVVPFE